MTAILAHGAAAEPYGARPRRGISAGVRRLVLVYVWLTVASSAIVFSEPALYDVLMLGAALLLPVVGMVSFSRGLGLYCMIWAIIAAGGYIATTQAGIFDVPVTHMSIALYLAFTSVVMAAFVARAPDRRIRLIMSAYMVAALVARVAALVGYFGLVPGTYDLFTEFGRAAAPSRTPTCWAPLSCLPCSTPSTRS